MHEENAAAAVGYKSLRIRAIASQLGGKGMYIHTPFCLNISTQIGGKTNKNVVLH